MGSDEDSNHRLAREFRLTRNRLVALIQELSRECRDCVQEAVPRAASAAHPWPYERTTACVERLVVHLGPRRDGAVSRRLEEARKLQSRMSCAREALIVDNLGIVKIMAAQVYTGVIPVRDLVQDGYLGLLKAVDRFDPDRGNKFSTYACWWIRRAFNNAFDARARMIRLPGPVRRKLHEMRRTTNELESRLDRVPTDRELADRLGLSVKMLRNLRHVVAEPTALEDLAGDRKGGWGDRVPASDADDPFEAWLRVELHSHTRQAVRRLSPREQVVIRLRFGFDGLEALTLQQIAALLGLSRERVRQIETAAFDKLGRWVRRARIHPC